MIFVRREILLFVCAFTLCHALLVGEEVLSNQKQYVSSVTVIDNQLIVKFDETVALSKAVYADDEGVYVFEDDLEPIQSKDWTTWKCDNCGYRKNYVWSIYCEKCHRSRNLR